MKVNPEIVEQNVKFALKEDIGSGDVTAGLILESEIISAQIICRENMVLCGQQWVDAVFKTVDPNLKLEWLVIDGMHATAGSTICIIKGIAAHILTAERTALNFLQTLSATSTRAYHFVTALKDSKTKLLDTRKTLPGLRHAQKYAVYCGGGVNHRHGLYDAYLIKENHILACGSIQNAIEKARQLNPNLLLEIEVENLSEFEEAMAFEPDRIMLDNFNLVDIEKAVSLRSNKKIEIEVSGGVDLNSLASFAKTGVDFVSVGAITKSIQAIDLSLLILKNS